MCTNERTLTDFEIRAIQMMLAGDDPVLRILRKQYAHAIIESKEYTGHGFYIYFDIPEFVERLPGKQNFTFGDIEGRSPIPSAHPGLGFLLFVRNGVLTTFEGYANATWDWPTNVEEFYLEYYDNPRNLEYIRKSWAE